jgi:hypothetical protein
MRGCLNPQLTDLALAERPISIAVQRERARARDHLTRKRAMCHNALGDGRRRQSCPPSVFFLGNPLPPESIHIRMLSVPARSRVAKGSAWLRRTHRGAKKSAPMLANFAKPSAGKK